MTENDWRQATTSLAAITKIDLFFANSESGFSDENSNLF